MQIPDSLKKSRLRVASSLLFLCFLFSGFSLSSSKSGGRSFPLPGNFEDAWNATIMTLETQKIPIAVTDKARGYIQTATFPLYKKEYQEWAKAPMIFSQGFCALEIGIVEKDPTLTVVGIKAYFKRKGGFSSRPLNKKTDKSQGVFEGLLGKNIHERIVKKNFPALKSIILGCNLHYDDVTAHYFVTEADPSTLAYEQGLRNWDVLMKIDGEDVTPANLFGFFLNIKDEKIKKFTIRRKDGDVELPITIFFLNPDAPRLGFTVGRDPKTLRFIVTDVRAGSPAEKEGLLPGDVVLKQNDVVLDSWKHYYRAILDEKEGQPQVFTVGRGGKVIEKRITPAGKHIPA